MLNISHRKVGGIHFVRLGFLTMSFCVSRKRALHANAEARRMDTTSAGSLVIGAAGYLSLIAIGF